MSGSGPDPRGTDHRAGEVPVAEPGLTAAADAELIRDVVLNCPDVVALSAGPFGEVASYLPGRQVAGVRVDDERVEVHVIVDYGRPLQEIANDIGHAVGPMLAGRPLRVVVDDVVLPGQSANDRGIGNDVR